MEKKKDTKKVKRFINLMHLVEDTCSAMEETDFAVYTTLILLKAARQSSKETVLTLVQSLFDLEEEMKEEMEVALMVGYCNDFKTGYGK